MTAATPPPLAADLTEGLKRLKLRAIRQLAPEVLQTAKTQRWAPEELLRTLVEAEVDARDAANLANRLKTAAFPVVKTLEEFQPRRRRSPPRRWTTWHRWNGSTRPRTSCSSAHPAPASPTC